MGHTTVSRTALLSSGLYARFPEKISFEQRVLCQRGLETIVWKVPCSLCTGKFEATALGNKLTPKGFPPGPAPLAMTHRAVTSINSQQLKHH